MRFLVGTGRRQVLIGTQRGAFLDRRSRREDTPQCGVWDAGERSWLTRRKGRRLDYFLSSSGISDGIRGADDTTGLVNNVEG